MMIIINFEKKLIFNFKIVKIIQKEQNIFG